MTARSGGVGALELARIIRRLKARVTPAELGGETVEQLVRRWSRVSYPELGVRVREYDPRWPQRFETESRRIQAALSPEGAVEIQHVGSTSIPPLPGKNIIDLAVAVRALPPTERQMRALVDIGYQHYGASPIDAAFPWFWRVEPEPGDDPGSFVVHVCTTDHPWFANLVNFRDFMRVFPEERQRYADLKRELAAVPDQSWFEYSVIKRALALQITARANAWAAARG
ncbi:MAG TPA: GrpB family protein [Kofleriaceae bacterium]|nr:GrpB family protein [Kofleriaceae bacterium]